MTPLLGQQFYMSVCSEAFKISVIVPSSNTHLVGVITSNQGGGTDSAHVPMGEGNNAHSGAAGKMRGRAFMVMMVGGSAVSTTPVIGAIAGLVSCVLAMTSEAINMRGEGALSLAKQYM